MTQSSQTPIIQLIGPNGSGKTTLCQLFLDAFSDQSVLAVDSSEDGFLALTYGVQSSQTLGQVTEKLNKEPISREAMDWTLQDLPIGVPSESESDILIWDKLPGLTPETEALLAYGLPRLFQTYDVVVWDGNAPFPASLMPAMLEGIYTLIVITGQDEPYCQNLASKNHAMVLLSKAAPTDSLPPTAQEQVRKGNWQFLGKLPPLNSPEKRVKELPQYFQECFQKLDLPLALRFH